MRDINLIVIHCSATKEGIDYDVKQIRKRYKHDPFIAKEVSAFMESPDFSETRDQLGIM